VNYDTNKGKLTGSNILDLVILRIQKVFNFKSEILTRVIYHGKILQIKGFKKAILEQFIKGLSILLKSQFYSIDEFQD
jgi:hypothetical protein